MPITYHNVTPTADGGRGTLFSDMKFWVSLRITNRNEILSNIMHNGGKIKKLEKLADYRIVDPTKEPQPGSYSYEWITSSVRAGIVLPKENFAYAGGTAAARPNAASSRRGIRAAFTDEEDRLLTAWVIMYENLGYGSSGKKMYEPLAQKYPRHTEQSWRDRWVKKLSKIPRMAISQEELDAIKIDEPGADRPLSLPTPVHQTTQPGPSASASSGRNRGPLSMAKFTPEEDLVLLNRYFEVASDPRLSKLKDLYGMLEDKYPQHSAAAWADRLRKTIEAKVRDKLETTLQDLREEHMPQLVAWLHSIKQDAESFWASVEQEAPVIASPPRVQAPKPVVKSEAAKRSIGKNARATTTASPTPADPKTHAKTPIRVDPKTTPKPKPKVAAIVQEAPVIPSSPPAQDSSPPSSPQLPRSVSMSPSLPQLPMTFVRTTTSKDDPADEESDDKANFYNDYFVFVSTFEQKAMYFPSVLGKSFELWDLWREVQIQGMPPDQRDWQVVAENLGIDWDQLPDAPELVRQFYEAHLAQFEEAKHAFDESDNDEATQMATEPVMPSSPPVVRQVKRPARSELEERPVSVSPRKRRRYDPSSEIASTPDDKTGTAHLRHVGDGSDPLQDNYEDDVDEEFEAETQTFQYETAKETQYYEAMEVGTDGEDEDITPSQQLQLESDSIKPPDKTTPSPQPPPKTRSAASLPIRSTPTPKQRVTRTPFLTNDDDDDDDLNEQRTPLSRFKKPWTEKVKAAPAAKRRSLPKSFAVEQPAASSSRQPEATSKPARPTTPQSPKPTTQPASSAPVLKSSAVAASTLASSAKRSSKQLPDKPPSQTQQQQQQQDGPKVEAIITHHTSLGFTREVVIKAMHATTWNSGLSKVVMAELKKGNPIPRNAQGVWTAKDDENLEFIMEVEGEGGQQQTLPAEGTVTRKMLDKARRKVENKHTPAMIESRKKWLRQDEGSAWKAIR